MQLSSYARGAIQSCNELDLQGYLILHRSSSPHNAPERSPDIHCRCPRAYQVDLPSPGALCDAVFFDMAQRSCRIKMRDAYKQELRIRNIS